MLQHPLRVLIVDDDESYSGFLKTVVSDIEGIETVDTAINGRIALAKLKRTSVDLVLLDIDMPIMDGLETLERIRESHPEVGVVMVSAVHAADADKVIRALELGAVDYVSKLETYNGSVYLAHRQRLMTLTGLLRARRNTRLTRQLAEDHSPPGAPTSTLASLPSGPRAQFGTASGAAVARAPLRSPLVSPEIEVVVVGISTGGPNALAQMVPAFPENLGVPVLLVQHIPAALTSSLAVSLDQKSKLKVREAVDGEEILPDTVYVAPGGKHMVVTRNRSAPGGGSKRILFRYSPPVNSCRPSADVLFRSISETFDGTVLAVIMTGMGSDGAAGVRALKARSCYCLTQTEDTCVVYGMPRAVDEAGLSDERVALERIGQRIVDIVKGGLRANRQ